MVDQINVTVSSEITSKVTRLPTIEAVHVLAFIALPFFVLTFVSTKVSFVSSFLFFITLPFNFFCPKLEGSFFFTWSYKPVH